MGIDSISSVNPAKMPVIKQNQENRISGSEKVNTATEAAIGSLKEDMSKEKIAKMVEGLNQFIKPTHTTLKFQLHDKLNEYYVSVVDSVTKEVVREIPPKKLLDMYVQMMESIGIFVDKKI